jgi:ADP-heptose:LPS heptosyltransferase
MLGGNFLQTECAVHRHFLVDRLQRIVVFRALYLGDMLCAVPALRALRCAAQRAHIALIGLPWAREFATRCNHYVDEFIEFPGFPGLPEQTADAASVEGFLCDMRARQFDLAIQMHGDGTTSNRVCAKLGARHAAGYYAAGHECPDVATFLPFPDEEHEIRRHLRLMEFLGARPCGEELEFPTTSEDYEQLKTAAKSPELLSGNYVCLHAGGKLATRRWPAERFAHVANTLADHGMYPVLTGTGAERPLVQQVSDLIRAPHLNLCGRTDLGMLAALVERARLVVTNDTGVSHLAAAVRTPSVVIFLGSDRARWSPLDRSRHLAVSEPVECRPCEHDDCPIGFVCADLVHPDKVASAAFNLLRESSVLDRKHESNSKFSAAGEFYQLSSY